MHSKFSWVYRRTTVATPSLLDAMKHNLVSSLKTYLPVVFWCFEWWVRSYYPIILGKAWWRSRWANVHSCFCVDRKAAANIRHVYNNHHPPIVMFGRSCCRTRSDSKINIMRSSVISEVAVLVFCEQRSQIMWEVQSEKSMTLQRHPQLAMASPVIEEGMLTMYLRIHSTRYRFRFCSSTQLTTIDDTRVSWWVAGWARTKLQSCINHDLVIRSQLLRTSKKEKSW